MLARIGIYLKAKEQAERELREAEAKRQREEQERLAAEAQRLLLAAMDVQQILQLVDDAISDFRAAAGAQQFDLALHATVAAPVPTPLLAAPSPEESVTASAADLARTRSAIAGTGTLTSDLDWEVTDHRRAVQILADYVSADALDHAINAYKRTYKGADNRDRIIKTQPVTGVRFFLKQQARVV